MEWIRGRLLSSYYIPGNGDYFDMSYSADGKRVQKTQSYDDETSDWVTTYIYNGNNLVCQKEDDGSSTYYKYFLYNSQGIIGYIQDGVTYTYRKNLFGDITAIYQGATKVAEYAYDAWGNCTVTNLTSSKIGSFNPFRYRGYYWDEDLQLYYLMSRYYDPQTGRFINADSLEYLDPETIGGLNLYAYCLNNPVMKADPTGTISWLIFGLVVLVGAIVGGVLAAKNSIEGQSAVDSIREEQSMQSQPLGPNNAVRQPPTQKSEVNVGKVIIDTLWGAALGAAGAAILYSAYGLIIGSKIMFAAGVLVWNTVATVIAPLLGITMIVIEGTRTAETVEDMQEMAK